MGIFFILILIFGWRYPLLGYFIPLCMILGIAIGLSRGRKWCDWYCPRGSFYDYFFSFNLKSRDIPRSFKKITFRLAVLGALMLVMFVNLILRWPDPNKIGSFFIIMLTVTTTVGIILAIFYHRRSWCMICPVGTLINLVGNSRYPLTIDSDLCIECKSCAKSCPIQIKPYQYKAIGLQEINNRDCLKCGLCVSGCPVKALSSGKGRIKH